MRRSVTLLLIALVCSLWPALVYAQASISGTVRDTSGAVLPGVTVEASSPALIEKVRTTISDGGGQYRIENLPPGAYAVTFTLAGFTTFRREGLQLSGSFAAVVDAAMAVGELAETVTVTGAAPTVDTQNVTRQAVLDQQLIDTAPLGSRNYYSITTVLPGVTASNQDVGGFLGDAMTHVLMHGSKAADWRVMQNGVPSGTLIAGGGLSGSVQNSQAAAEVVVDTAAASAESSLGGPRINYIPRSGGNSFSGTGDVSFATEAMQGDNLTDRVRALGARTVDSVRHLFEASPGFGGPIRRDRLWFYAAGRYTNNERYAGGMFYNKNAKNPNAWTFEPDLSRPAINSDEYTDMQARLTWQATSIHKLAAHWVSQTKQLDRKRLSFVNAITAPEANDNFRFPLSHQAYADWTAPFNNRLLMEATMAWHTQRYGNMEPSSEIVLLGLEAVTEQSTGLTYRQRPSGYTNNWNYQDFFRVSASYITGSHAAKFGITNMRGHLENSFYAHNPLQYRFNRGVPNLITMFALPFEGLADLDADLGIFAQDKWTLDRLTLTAGLRFDYFATSFLEQRLGPAPLAPNRNVVFPAQDNLAWKDILPRLGVVYDPTGSGRTAVKVSLSKYVAGQMMEGKAFNPNPVNSTVRVTARSWNDANGDFRPDCDLLVRGANGECGPMANPNFGTAVPAETYDSDLLRGWGKRHANWEFSTSVQHEIVPRVSVDVGFFRRWFQNFWVVDDLALAPTDFDRFSITAPLDSRLPEGGGYLVDGLLNVKPEKFGTPAQLHSTLADKYGDMSESWTGFDIYATARAGNGLLFQGGTSTGRAARNSCEIIEKIPEMQYFAPAGGQVTGAGSAGSGFVSQVVAEGVRQSSSWCDVTEKFTTQVKLLGSYTVPRVDVQVSGTFQSMPGPGLEANYVASNAVIAPSLGRSLSGGVTNVVVNIVEPGREFGDRLNQLDFRVAKILRAGRARATVGVDVYNVLNSDVARIENSSFGAWRLPIRIVPARFARINVQFDF